MLADELVVVDKAAVGVLEEAGAEALDEEETATAELEATTLEPPILTAAARLRDALLDVATAGVEVVGMAAEELEVVVMATPILAIPPPKAAAR